MLRSFVRIFFNIKKDTLENIPTAAAKIWFFFHETVARITYPELQEILFVVDNISVGSKWTKMCPTSNTPG